MRNYKSLSEENKLYSIIFVLLLGSLWGLLELVFGHYLRTSYLPLKGAVLTGMSMGIMGLGYGINLRPMLLPFVALITAGTMQLGVPILNCSPMCRANSMLAVTLHGAALGSLLHLTSGKGQPSYIKFGLIGFGAALVSGLLFYPLGINLAPCMYLLSFGAQGGITTFFYKEALLWAAFSSISLPLGIYFGKLTRTQLQQLGQKTPGLIYSASSVSLVLCIGVIIFLLKNGF